MRSEGDIVLLSLYEIGHPPLTTAWPLAFLRQAGFRPVTFDLAVDPPPAAVVRALERARLVCFAVPMHTAMRLGLRLAAAVREWNPGAHLCFHGTYAGLGAATLARRDAVTALSGEIEAELVALAEALERGEAPSPRSSSVERLEMIPPARDGLDLRRYAKLIVPGPHGDEERLAGYVEATRGCKHMCRHCPIPAVYHGRFFAVPVEVVLEDARRQIALGARHITFGDPDFLNGPRHALAVARALHDEHPGVSFDVTCKVEHILRHREVFPELARLGCLFVVSAVESLSDQVLDILAKNHTRAGAGEALAVVRAAGLSLRPTFVAFTPWTTREDYRDLCRFVAEHDLLDEVDPVQLSLRLLIPPGSLLLDRPELAPHLGALDEDAFTFRWTHPDPAMDALQAGAARLCEDAAARGEPPRGTFARLFALAGAGSFARPRHRLPPPRLSEPWFC